MTKPKPKKQPAGAAERQLEHLAELRGRLEAVANAPTTSLAPDDAPLDAPPLALAIGHTTIAIPLELIDESPSNPRQHYDAGALDELAADVRRRGVLQACLVRPVDHPLGRRYELVYGSRRYRAARAAELRELPCVVRELGDAAVLELQLVENAKRVNISALEEAEAYRRLRDEYGLGADEIAERVHKSKASVYARLKLCELSPAGREAFAQGKVDASTALLVARIPVEALQIQALNDIVGDDRGGYNDGEPMSFRRAQAHIQERYMLALDSAGFDVADAQLVPAAGTCGTCPKRTGNAAELFADVDRADVCTDPSCFRGKRDAAWQAVQAAAAVTGKAVLAPKEAEKVFTTYQPDRVSRDRNCAFVDLAETEYVSGTGRSKPWRSLLGKDLPPVTLAQDRTGKVHELVDRRIAEAALRKFSRALGTDTAGRAPPAGTTVDREAMKRQAEEREVGAEVARRLVERLVIAVVKREPGPALWSWIVQQLINLTENAAAVATRRELVGDDADFDQAQDALEELAGSMPGAGQRALAVELLATPARYCALTAENVDLHDACKAVGIDAPKAVKEIAAAVKAERKAAAKAAPASGKNGNGRTNSKTKPARAAAQAV